MRSVTFALLAVTTFGCSSWKGAKAPLSTELARPEPPVQVRVLLDDGVWHVVRNPQVAGDSLKGTDVIATGGSLVRDPQLSYQPIAVPLARVRRVETRQGDAIKTTGLVAVLGILAVVVGYAVAWGSMPQPIGF